MDYIERGTPNNKNTSTGWLTRHLQVMHPDGMLPTLAAGSAAPNSLLGEPEAVAMNDPRSYGLSGPWQYTNNSDSRYKDAMLNTATKFYTGSDIVQDAGKRTIETINALRGTVDYIPTHHLPQRRLRRFAQGGGADDQARYRAARGDGGPGRLGSPRERGRQRTYGPFNRLVGTARARPARLLQRPARPPEQADGGGDERVRPAPGREPEQRHRPRPRQYDAGAGRPGQWRQGLRHLAGARR